MLSSNSPISQVMQNVNDYNDLSWFTLYQICKDFFFLFAGQYGMLSSTLKDEKIPCIANFCVDCGEPLGEQSSNVHQKLHKYP